MQCSLNFHRKIEKFGRKSPDNKFQQRPPRCLWKLYSKYSIYSPNKIFGNPNADPPGEKNTTESGKQAVYA